MSDRTTVCADCGYPVRLVHRFPDGVEPDDYESHSALASQPEPAVTEALRRHTPTLHPEAPDWERVWCSCGKREDFGGWWAHIKIEVVEKALAAVPAPSPAPAAEPSTCPTGCGCRLWTEDADARDCGCDGPCCFDSWDDYIADVLDRPDYYRELYNGSRATPLPEARAASPSPAVAPLDQIVKIAAHALCHGKTCDGGKDGDLICPPHGEAALAFAAAYAEASEQEGEA